jgi:hypothetical protein
VTEEGERAGKDEPQWRRDGRARAPAEQGRMKEVISADYDLLSTSALHLQEEVVVGRCHWRASGTERGIAAHKIR